MSDDSLESLPDKMILRGGAFNTRYRGNGLMFDHEAAAEMVDQMNGGQFVRNHDREIAAIAGLITHAEAVRNDIPRSELFSEDNDDDEDDPYGDSAQNEGEDLVSTTKIRFEAELSADFAAYEEVARSILARRKHGLTPNVSIAFFAGGLEATEDGLKLTGPYQFAHLGHVDIGAQRPEQGVGVEGVEITQAKGAKFLKSLANGRENGQIEVEMDQTGLICMNLDDLTAKFEAEHGFNPLKTPEKSSQVLEMGETRHLTVGIGPEGSDFGSESSSIEENELKVPNNPPGGSGEGKEGQWSAPTLSDFTDEQWGELSSEEKNRIASYYADATNSWTDNFDDDLNLPHHDPDDGKAVLNGVRNALARLPQTDNLHSSADAVESHLQSHLASEEAKTWEHYSDGLVNLETVAELVGFTLEEIGMDSEADQESQIVEENGRKILDLSASTDNSSASTTISMSGNNDDVTISTTNDITLSSGVWSNSVSSGMDEAKNKKFDVDNTNISTSSSNLDVDNLNFTVRDGANPGFASDSLSNDDEEQLNVDSPHKDGANLSEQDTPSEANKTDAELEQELDKELENLETEAPAEESEELEEAEVEELSGDEDVLELPSEFKALKEEYNEMKNALDTILAERRAKEKAELDELRERLSLEFGVDENTIEKFETKEQLEALGESLRSARQNRLPNGPAKNRDVENDARVKAEQERKQWLDDQYIGA